MSAPDVERLKEIADSRVLEHEKECREGAGPMAEVRRDLGKLTTWVKGIGITLMLLEALHTYGSLVAKVSPSAVPAAKAAEVSHVGTANR